LNFDEKYMHRALQLAEIGRGNVSPNPMVGCVIVHNDIIIGEGWHRKYGDWHAEVNAINSVLDMLRLSLVRTSEKRLLVPICW
jgi:diaminohydroxyphosphoribosylaminopyrimidine deaminase/5-amino-6-(5-phosphoribosylamino)uracil reductase